MCAVDAALIALGFLELPQEDSPPENIWHHETRLLEWFQAVRHRREHPDRELIPDADDETMTSNEYAKG